MNKDYHRPIGYRRSTISRDRHRVRVRVRVRVGVRVVVRVRTYAMAAPRYGGPESPASYYF